ncbi:LOW QUALITY PROTEIN: hypothetical protein PanWU01x14_239280 [Parasponia andersonii]|uniref:Uncharacterized protein n=1 Tax=Parasponia andersonii TaxID=3476 RepID=A0A2P5BH79_PARAD|nr:LOW QUALITY PROTEIN: hypothetical protein PanWU01x14_239280 [Parasponia andersonii]
MKNGRVPKRTAGLAIKPFYLLKSLVRFKSLHGTIAENGKRVENGSYWIVFPDISLPSRSLGLTDEMHSSVAFGLVHICSIWFGLVWFGLSCRPCPWSGLSED